MSDYHVKSITPDGRKANVVFHIPIPVENNSAGVALRTAVSQYVDGTNFESQVPWIPGTELTQMQDGELYEHSESVTFGATDTDSQKQTQLDNRYTALSISILNRVRAILKFWGKDRNIP